jgi:hypothetical protein
MKTRVLLIALSLVANVILLAAIADRGIPAIGFRTSTAAGPNDPAGRGSAPTVAPAESFKPETWSGLSTGDFATVAARLKTEGFPISVRRSILAALVAQQFADRHRALAAMINAQPWWTTLGMPAPILAARQQLARDEKEAVDAALGEESGASAYAHARQVHQYGDLPDSQLRELDRITRDYDELINEVRSSAQGILLAEDREKIAYLEKEKRADISKLLSPDQLLEYDLRSSPTASALRQQLVAFNPSEDEFRAMFKVQQAFDLEHGVTSPELMTPAQRLAQVQGRKELTAQMKGVLSPERFPEYEQKTDPAYLQANAVVTRLQLPPTATAEIVAVQKDVTQRANAIRSDRTLNPEQRTAQLSALGSEAVLRLTPTLGAAGLAAYRQAGAGWLNGLQPPPPPPPPPGQAPVAPKP